MTQEEATQILDRSLTSLRNRKSEAHHRVYLTDVELKVVQVACLTILQNRAIKQAEEYATLFTQAAMNLVSIYTEKEAAIGVRDIVKNVQWDALWEQLQEYFQKTHGREIGEENHW